MTELDGKVALVTGSTTGIGATIASRMAEEGASVVVTGRTPERGERVASEIRDQGGRALFVALDIGVESEIEAAIAAAEAEFGKLDILVNNAAPIDRLHLEQPIGELPTEVMESLLRVGLFGTMWALKYGVRALTRAGGGAIVNISSNVATLGFPGTPVYTAMKGATDALTRQVAVDYAAENIRCNAISLGAVGGGPLVASMMEEYPETWKAVENAHLLRVGRPEDIANAAIFLASERSEWITATIVYADGGMVGRAPFNFAETLDG